jgi:glycosyltransferase involved in cell wall biosynthesis
MVGSALLRSRLAWFTPLPPAKSGIAQYNAELLPGLASAYQLDLFVDDSPESFRSPAPNLPVYGAHDFVWKHAREPYDLVVYQLGNAPCHDYMWAYLTRFPGLVVLHDGQLHHARGRTLLQQWHPRKENYRREFWFNHPDANPDLAELGSVGLLGSLTYFWPMLRIVIESSRRVLVHNAWLADQIRDDHPGVLVDVVEMGVPESAPPHGEREQIRSKYGIAEDAVVFTAFGKVTPEKRVREALRAMASIATSHAHLLVAGETVDYYDLHMEAEALGIATQVTFAGYVADEEVDAHLAASDVCLCMRWPTSRETSASWLRCLAAGKPTISTDLVHTVDVPTLDPRDWSLLDARRTDEKSIGAVGVSIDILDEEHSLKLAIRRLATDAKLRAMLGSNAKALWAERFRLERMAAGYRETIERAIETKIPGPERRSSLPAHLRSSGTEHAESLVKEIMGSEYHLRDAD